LAIFPFTGNLTTGELIQFAPGQNRQVDPYLAGGRQRLATTYEEQYSQLAKFGLTSATVAGGFYGARKLGLNPMDYLYAGVRTWEDFSPGQVFKTFALGDFLSQFTKDNLAYRHIDPQQIQKIRNTAWFQDLMHRAGPDRALEATLHGLT